MASQSTSLPPQQTSLFSEKKRAAAPLPTTTVSPKTSFTPCTFENALDPGMVKDHAMLWLRGTMKKTRKNPKAFLKTQKQEIKFKRTESDPLSIIRSMLVED